MAKLHVLSCLGEISPKFKFLKVHVRTLSCDLFQTVATRCYRLFRTVFDLVRNQYAFIVRCNTVFPRLSAWSRMSARSEEDMITKNESQMSARAQKILKLMSAGAIWGSMVY